MILQLNQNANHKKHHYENCEAKSFVVDLDICCKHFLYSDSEWLWKTNVIDEVEQDTMEFDYMKKHVFRPEYSNNLTGNEIITTIHPGTK